jgi:crossover junction endodeoxyribonuclease RusA
MIDLTLPWPCSVNHYWVRTHHGGMMISAAGRAFRDSVILIVRKLEGKDWKIIGEPRRLGPIMVQIKAYPPDRRRRDLDNICKGILDALQHAGCYDDDSQIDMLMVERGPMIKGGKIHVFISDYARKGGGKRFVPAAERRWKTICPCCGKAVEAERGIPKKHVLQLQGGGKK